MYSTIPTIKWPLGASEGFNDSPRRIAPITRIRSSKGYPAYYRTFDALFLSLPQIAAVLEAGDTASPPGPKSG